MKLFAVKTEKKYRVISCNNHSANTAVIIWKGFFLNSQRKSAIFLHSLLDLRLFSANICQWTKHKDKRITFTKVGSHLTYQESWGCKKNGCINFKTVLGRSEIQIIEVRASNGRYSFPRDSWGSFWGQCWGLLGWTTQYWSGWVGIISGTADWIRQIIHTMWL